MGWIDSLHGNIVAIDTAPLIYFIEESPAYVTVVDPFFEALQHGEFAVVTSVMSLLEALVVPLRRGDTDLARKYRDILSKTRGQRPCQSSQVLLRKQPNCEHPIISALQMLFKWLPLPLHALNSS